MKTGLVLSGGGARGFAHVGMIQALGEMGINFQMISGVSSGAVIGAYLASGIKYNEILGIVKQTELFSILDLRLLKPGLFKTDAVRKSLEKHLDGMTFEMMKIPFVVAATDFKNGSTKYFSKGNVIEAVLASSAIPALYQPVKINNELYVDGGLLNNFPIEPLTDCCDIIVGTHVNPLDILDIRKLNIASVIDRSFHLAIGNSVRSKQQLCTLFLEPPGLSIFGVFDMDDADIIFKIGYDYIIKMRKQIEEKFRIIL